MWPIAVTIIMGAILLMFVYATNSIKGKLLVTFHRQNLTKVEKWCSIKQRHVHFGKGEGGKGYYQVNPEHIELMQFNRGIVFKIFPQMVPSIEFGWDSPDSINPRRNQESWHTPELRAAAWQEYSAQAFAKGTATQVGKKERFPNWFFPALSLGVIVIVLYFVYMQAGEISSIKEYLANIR